MTRQLHPLDVAIERALHDYRTALGWQVRRVDSEILLTVGQGMVGVRLPVSRAKPVVARLRRWDTLGPVINLPGDDPTWVVLADPDADDTAVTQGIALGVHFLFAGQEIPLPPSSTPHGRPHWIEPPNVALRWLPSCGAVLTALRGPRPARIQHGPNGCTKVQS